MVTEMKAVVARGGAARVETRAVPVPGPNDVVVRTSAASMCSADVASIAGNFSFVEVDDSGQGVVLGHESVGTVHEIGELVSGFAVGDRVASMSTTPCGQCENCQRGWKGHCSGVVWGGYTAGVSRDGTLAEYYVVPSARENLAHIPDGVSDEAALLAVDTLASGSSGIEAANLPLGGVVVVLGQGHVGLAAMVTARLSGAGLVIAVKNSPGGEARGTALGADVVLNHREHDVRGEVLRLTEGRGADCVVEATGVRSVFPLAIELTRLGGVISVLSSYEGAPEEGDASLSIPLQHWGWGVGDKRIISTFQLCGSERLGRLMRLLEQGRIDVGEFFTHTYDFDDVERALTELSDSTYGVLKPVIRFS
jgi:threonine dehydrogenase-like Zn-dependent dehydrogenase